MFFFFRLLVKFILLVLRLARRTTTGKTPSTCTYCEKTRVIRMSRRSIHSIVMHSIG